MEIPEETIGLFYYSKTTNKVSAIASYAWSSRAFHKIAAISDGDILWFVKGYDSFRYKEMEPVAYVKKEGTIGDIFSTKNWESFLVNDRKDFSMPSEMLTTALLLGLEIKTE